MELGSTRFKLFPPWIAKLLHCSSNPCALKTKPLSPRPRSLYPCLGREETSTDRVCAPQSAWGFPVQGLRYTVEGS